MSSKQYFAARLKQLRKQCGLTQQVIAEIMGIDRSTYTYYETGKTYPDLDGLCRLANIFRVSADTLLGLTPAKAAVQDNSLTFAEPIVSGFAELSGDEQLLILQYRELTSEQRTALLKTMREDLMERS